MLQNRAPVLVRFVQLILCAGYPLFSDRQMMTAPAEYYSGVDSTVPTNEKVARVLRSMCLGNQANLQF